MTKLEKITRNINNNKELQNNFKKLYNYTSEDFIHNANSYIKAIKNGSMCCVIDSVSSSGMSRNLKFISCGKYKTRHTYRSHSCLFTALGYKEAKNSTFKVHGCGMDMVFHTNYTIIYNLYNLGFINKKQRDILAQQTPTVL